MAKSKSRNPVGKSKPRHPEATSQPKDPDAVRQQVLADPHTAEIAASIGMPVEEYAERVVYFATHPEEDAMVHVLEDDELRELGYEPPDANEVGKYLVDALLVAEASDATEYTDSKRALVAIPDEPAAKGVADPQLKRQLDEQMRTQRSRKG